MAGEIEEPFRFNFQADLLNSGSISFGRFESESLSWERRSSFSHNRYLEEVEKYSKPGSVTEKKAYFEAHFRRKALLKQSSSECQDARTSENDEPQDLQESDNGNESKQFTCFDESPHSSTHSKCDEEIEIQKCESNHVISFEKGEMVECEREEVLSVAAKDESMVKNVDHMVMPASEMKQTKGKQKAHGYVSQFQKTISSEASNGSAPRTRKNEGLLVKEKEKSSPRPASPITYSGRKTSKSEVSTTSNPKAKILPAKKSYVKEYKSETTMEAKSKVLEKSLPGGCQTANRIKQTISLSKPHTNPGVAGFTFKSDERAERRKEEKKAAEMAQPRKNQNFKATPMPSFYKESTRPDQNKVVSTSKAPSRPRTQSMATRSNRFPSTSSDTRPSSSISLTHRNHYAPEKRVLEKKKESSSLKQKEGEATKGPRGRVTSRKDSKGVHMGSGHLAVVGVAT